MRFVYFKNKKEGIVSLFLLVFISACSTSHRAVDSKSTIIPKELYPKPALQKPMEGALWPGNTRGNFLFGDDAYPAGKKLSDQMQSYWAEFAYTGNPGTGREGDLPEWNAWSNSESDKYLVA